MGLCQPCLIRKIAVVVPTPQHRGSDRKSGISMLCKEVLFTSFSYSSQILDDLDAARAAAKMDGSGGNGLHWL